MVYLTFTVIENFISTRKAQKRCCSQLDEVEARTLVWKPTARLDYMFRFDHGEGF